MPDNYTQVRKPYRDAVDAVTVEVIVMPAISESSSFAFAFCSGLREDPFEPLRLLIVR